MDNLKDEIKRRLNIVDVIGATVTLRKTGKDYQGFCPFHNNTKTEALAVFPETQSWHCFGECKTGGDIFDFVMLRDKLDFNQAIAQLAAQAGVNSNGHQPAPKTKRTNQPQYDFGRHPDIIYSYRDETGREVAQVCRQNLPAGGKAIRPRFHNGKEWVWSKPENMPLYRLPELIKADPALWVHLTEGEKNADTLAQLGLIATTNAFGAGVWDNRYNGYFAGRKVAVYQDNDAAGQNRVAALALALYDVAQMVKIITPQSLGIVDVNKGDVTNAFELGRLTIGQLETIIDNLPAYHPPDHILWKNRLWSIDDLMQTTFPARNWLIANLLPDGLTLLAGKQKTGKSWFVLQLLLAISQGQPFLGRPTTATRCLYLGLEDGPGRFQDRVNRLDYRPGANNLLVKFTWPNFVSENGLDDLEQVIEENGIGLIVTDTFTRACLGADQLKIDQVAPILARLQELAMNYRISVILTDHLKKPNGVRDSLYDVYGSIAKTMLADVIWNLSRDKDDMGQFLVEGRDIPQEFDFALKFDREKTIWQMLGEYDKVVLGEPEKKVLEALAQLGGKSHTQQLAENMGASKGYVNSALSKLLDKERVKQLPKEGKIQPYELI